jgi:hypothetical protein
MVFLIIILHPIKRGGFEEGKRAAVPLGIEGGRELRRWALVWQCGGTNPTFLSWRSSEA